MHVFDSLCPSAHFRAAAWAILADGFLQAFLLQAIWLQTVELHPIMLSTCTGASTAAGAARLRLSRQLRPETASVTGAARCPACTESCTIGLGHISERNAPANLHHSEDHLAALRPLPALGSAAAAGTRGKGCAVAVLKAAGMRGRAVVLWVWLS